MSHIQVCLVPDMERKSKISSILKTLDRLGLKYENQAAKIIVQEDSILDCHRKIDKMRKN